MEIIKDYPPLFDEIDAKFHVRGRDIIYAWGDRIYAPLGGDIPPQLMAHEKIHCARQGDDAEGWWRRYIADAAFRLDEEVLAHRIEYEVLAVGGNRQRRRGVLLRTARRMAAPLYGPMCSVKQAKRLIQEVRFNG